MTQDKLLDRAKKGELSAIVALLNSSLNLLGMEITQYSLTDNYLNLILQAPEVPNQQQAVIFVNQSLNNLSPKQIAKVKIFGRQQGENKAIWSEEFTLDKTNKIVLPTPIKSDASSTNTAIKSNPENTIFWRSTDETQPILNQDRTIIKPPAANKVPVINQDQTTVSKPREKARSVANQTSSTKSQPKQTNEFIKTLRTFQFDSVVPYREIFNSGLYKSKIVKLLLFFSLFPWLVSSLASNSGLADIAWILGIYYASIWGIVLYNLIKPLQFSWRDTLKCVGFTAFVGIPLLLFFQKVPPFSILYLATTTSSLIFNLVGFVLGVGVLEEVCKAFPVYFFLLRKNKLEEPLTAAFYGAMSGLGFAIAEGAHYSLIYALSLVEGNLDFGSYFSINTVRFISLPLIHAIWAGIVGYFLGLAAINPSRQKAIAFIGIAISATLHGLYNTFANDLLGLAILTFSILLFVTYLRRSKQMTAEMRLAETDQKAISD